MGADGVNFGGGGGGSMVLEGGDGIPLDDAETNFFGAGIVDTFLTPKSADTSSGFKNLKPCSELGRKNPRKLKFIKLYMLLSITA